MQEDVLYVEQTLKGDEQAFHRLIMKYYAAIYALTLSWVKNPEDAKDLTQEVFLEAYQGLASLKQPEQFNFWLKKIAKYHCQDWLRKEKTYIQLDENMPYETPSADEILILRETLAKVMKAIDELPKSESQLLKERYLDDVSYDEMETRHGLSHSVLAMRLFRAREKVRESVKKALAGFGILTFRYSAEDILTKGVVAVKMTIKAKIITAIVATSVILGGTGIIILNSHKTLQDVSKPEITKQSKQTEQKTSNTTFNKMPVLSEPIKEPAKIEEVYTYSEPQKKENPTKELNTLESVKNEEKTINTEEYEIPTKADIMLKEFRADMIPVAEGIDKEVPFQLVGGFFEALKNKDFTKAYEIANADLKFKFEDSIYSGISELTIGEPFQKEGRIYAGGKGLYVPYEVKLSNGYIKKWQVAIRFDNPGIWYFDGGL